MGVLGAVASAVAPRFAARPFSSGIKILEEAGHVQEQMYWHQEDEKLLKKMIESNPSLDPAFQGLSGISDDTSCSVSDKVKLVFMKHGIPPANKALIADIVALVESK